MRTAVLNSTGYPQFVVEGAGEVSARLLLLHGTADGNPADGGSELSKVDRARAGEARSGWRGGCSCWSSSARFCSSTHTTWPRGGWAMCSHGRALLFWCGLRRMRSCSTGGAGSFSTRARKAGLLTRPSYLRRLCIELQATAGPVRSPRIVMLDRVVKSLLRRQAFVKVGHCGDVADPRAARARETRLHLGALPPSPRVLSKG